MIAYLIILVAFYWLGTETHWLTIHLAMPAHYNQNLGVSDTLTHSLPLPELALEPKTEPVKVSDSPKMLAEQCEMTKLQKLLGKHYRHSWMHSTSEYNTRRPDSYQSMVVGNQTITLNATLPNLHELISEVVKAQATKARKPVSYHQPDHLPDCIEHVRTGSHTEFHPMIDQETGKPIRKRGYNVTVKDYTVKFNPCLPGVEWLKKHHKDEYPEATIEISVNGKSISLNGDYKPGKIAEFMKPYTKRTRAGKKMMTISTDEVVVNMGGGVYINVKESEVS